MAYIQTANRTVERSLNVAAISPVAYRSGKRLHIVGTIYTLLRVFFLPWSGSSIACIGMTNLAITLPFTLVVKLPASRADRLFLLPSKLSRGI